MIDIDHILEKYGYENKRGVISFNNYAYILVAKNLGLDWKKMSKQQKEFLKGDMVLQYSNQGFIRNNY